MSLKSVVTLLVFSFGLFAQTTPPALPTAVFPARQATLNDLQAAANLSFSTLTAQVNPGDLTLNVASGTVFPIPTSVVIDSEIIKICANTATTLTVCTGGRASEGTAAQTHLVGSWAQQRLTAQFHNQAAAEIVAIEKRALYVPYVTDFGAKCDGVTDDAIALTAALAYANTHATTLQIPPGTNNMCMTSVSLVVDNNGVAVDFLGQGPGYSGIGALAGGMFSTYVDRLSGTPKTFLISIGAPDCTAAQPYATVRNMQLSGNNVVDTVGYTSCGEENSGFRNVLVIGGRYTLLEYGFSAINAYGSDLSLYASPGSYGVINFGGSRNSFYGITINGGQSNGTGIANFGNANIHDVHCEHLNICVDNEGGANASLLNIDCSPGTSINTACVQLERFSATDVKQLTGNGVYGPLLKDMYRGTGGTTISGFGLRSYVQDGITLSSSDPSVPWNIANSLSLAGALNTPGPINLPHEVLGDWGNGAYLSIGTANPQGIFMQSANTPHAGSREGGGLNIGGGGGQGDPSLGWMLGGASYDGGTASATSGNAAGILIGQGTGTFVSNQGGLLTVDQTFAPQRVARWDAGGFVFQPQATVPDCSVNSIGRIWFNPNTSPYRVEFCTNTGWNYATLTAGP